MKHRVFGLTIALGLATPTMAYVTDAYLFSDWSSPSNVVGAPFTFVGGNGVRLILNASGQAVGTGAVPVVVSVGIEFAFQYRQHTGQLNAGESFSGTMENRVNSELELWDDAGFIDEGPVDAALNVDFSQGAVLFLQPCDCALTHILIAEDAGWDPFALLWDADGDFSSGAVPLFAGFDIPTRNAILARPDFGADDTGEDIDQVYLFVFGGDGLPPGYLAILEAGNFAAELLEIDFAGARCIPEPSAGVLVGLSLAAFAGFLSRGYRPRG